MNLAIHDFSLLRRLEETGATRTWRERGVRPWVIHGQAMGRADFEALCRSVPLELLEVTVEERPFFLVFQDRWRRFSYREVALLFLANQTGSALLATEPMVAGAAQSLGLRVCSGTQEALDQCFPLKKERSASLPYPTEGKAASPTVLSVCFPNQEAEERSASLPYHNEIGQVFLETVVEDLRERISPEPFPSSRRVPVRDEPVDPTPATALRRSKDGSLPDRMTQPQPQHN